MHAAYVPLSSSLLFSISYPEDEDDFYSFLEKTYVKYTASVYVAGNSCRRRTDFILQKVSPVLMLQKEKKGRKKTDIFIHKFKK
jgi:hypothetical protein